MNLGADPGSLISQGQVLAKKGLAEDTQLIALINNGVLKAIYELLLDLAYALFVAAVALTVSYDGTFGTEFRDYVQEPRQRGIVTVAVILGVIILALNKIHNDHQTANVTPTYRKVLALMEDVFRGIIYVILLVLVTPFVLNHSDVSLMMVAYFLYIISGAFFLAIKIIKWVSLLCGDAKNNDTIFQDPPVDPNQPADKALSGAVGGPSSGQKSIPSSPRKGGAQASGQLLSVIIKDIASNLSQQQPLSDRKLIKL